MLDLHYASWHEHQCASSWLELGRKGRLSCRPTFDRLIRCCRDVDSRSVALVSFVLKHDCCSTSVIIIKGF